jgi:hypothetical protein
MSWLKGQFRMKGAAQGTCFAVFGAAVIIVTLNQGIKMRFPTPGIAALPSPLVFTVLTKAANGQPLNNLEREALQNWLKQMREASPFADAVFG